MTGLIDEVRIWGVARTQAEIRADMRRRLDGNESGLVAYWPLDEGGGETIYDRTANSHGGLLGGGAVTSRPQWVEKHTRTTNLASSTLRGIIGYWPFDEGSGTTTVDASGHRLTGTLYGPSWSADTFDTAFANPYALSFDGVSDFVNVPHDNLQNPGEELTMAAWVKLDNLLEIGHSIFEFFSDGLRYHPPRIV